MAAPLKNHYLRRSLNGCFSDNLQLFLTVFSSVLCFSKEYNESLMKIGTAFLSSYSTVRKSVVDPFALPNSLQDILFTISSLDTSGLGKEPRE